MGLIIMLMSTQPGARSRRSLDAARGPVVVAMVVVLLAVAVTLTALAFVTIPVTWVDIVLLFVFLFGAVIAGGLIMERLTGRIAARYARVRQQAAAEAPKAGWTYSPTGSLPPAEVSEAVFHSDRMAIQVTTATEVTTGTASGFAFTASHLEGVLMDGPGKGTTQRSENIVVMTLAGPLPELRLRDRLAGTADDYGLNLPSVPSTHPLIDSRWEIQTSYPDFLSDLLVPEVQAYLAAIPPVPCTIVFRDGYLISCRDPEGSFASISERVHILAGLAGLIPAACWNRATPEVAGHGTYPVLVARANLTSWGQTRG
jgi:hypothetical protein